MNRQPKPVSSSIIHVPRVPPWAVPNGPIDSDVEAAWMAGSALNSLDNVARSDAPCLGAWRQRLALKAAVAIAKLMRRLKQSGETIVICSGRPDGWAEHTIAWLHKHDLPFDGVYLRAKDQDAASDPDVKRQALAQMQADGLAPWLVIDDRSSVVDAWRAEGLACLQCAPRDF